MMSKLAVKAIPAVTMTQNSHQIPQDIPKMRMSPQSAGQPVQVPRHLALADEEREHLQTHIDLVGIDKYMKFTIGNLLFIRSQTSTF